MFKRIRVWCERSLRNAIALHVTVIVLVTVVAISAASLVILYGLDREAIDAELRHDGKAAARGIEEPLRVVEDVLVELAKSTLVMMAMVDSGGRATYAAPYLQSYSFPVSVPNGLALCDIHGVRLAGSRSLSGCGADTDVFRRVLGDGQTRRTLERNREGRLVWTVYAAVTFPYTGTRAGVAVAWMDVGQVLDQLKALLSPEEIVLQIAGSDGAYGTNASGLARTVVSLFDGSPMLGTDRLELVVTTARTGVSSMFLPLLAGFLVTTMVVLTGILLRVRRWSARQVQPLIELRDRAQEIAATGNLALPIPQGGNDEVGQLARSFREMTDAIRSAEATRREAEERFRLVFEKSAEAILFGWPDGRIDLANPEVLRMFGYDEDSIKGVRREDFFDATDPRLGAALAKRNGSGAFSGELMCRHATGRCFPVEIVSTVFVDPKGELRTTTFFRDMTERKRIESAQAEQAARMAAMSRRLVAVQEEARRRLARELHDCTSPALAAISINLELSARAVRAQAIEEGVARISDTRALVEDTAINLRDICAELRPAALDYAGLVSALETYVGQLVRRTGIQVETRLQPLHQRPSAERESALFRIAQEALTNIVKHAGATKVEVILTCSGNEICLEVADNGRGFRMEEQDGVSGLGMINMREIAEFSGGVFSLTSEKGCGTRVCVRFACTEAGR